MHIFQNLRHSCAAKLLFFKLLGLDIMFLFFNFGVNVEKTQEATGFVSGAQPKSF